MLCNWISEKTKLQLPANLMDFDDIHIGLEFALSPEMLGILAGQLKAGPQTGINRGADNMPVKLDEHELALG